MYSLGIASAHKIVMYTQPVVQDELVTRLIWREATAQTILRPPDLPHMGLDNHIPHTKTNMSPAIEPHQISDASSNYFDYIKYQETAQLPH